jgi:hypothetical protein
MKDSEMQKVLDKYNQEYKEKADLAIEAADHLKDKTLEYCKKYCADNSIRYRIVSMDGKEAIITMDLDRTRLNFNVMNGVVKSINIY